VGRREPGTVERKPAKTLQRKRRRSRLLIPLTVMIVMGFLYYRPISTYRETRNEREARMEQVVALRAEKQRLERRLARATSAAALARDARRIGYVKPGERLFIVKGITSWRRTHRAPAR
jgi:Septum formation initiator